jgi:hypothetical protein
LFQNKSLVGNYLNGDLEVLLGNIEEEDDSNKDLTGTASKYIL